MLIYFILLVYIILFTELSRKIILVGINERNKNRINMLLIFIPMWLIMGLRYDVGRDYLSYEKIYNSVATGYIENLKHIEKGYLYFNLLLSKISDHSVVIFLVTSFIIVYFFLLTIYQRSNNIMLSIVLFFSLGYYFNSMNVVRQFVAIAISFYALKYINKEEIWKFCGCIIIAALFHKTALIYIPIAFVLIYLPNKLYYIVSSVILFVIGELGFVFLHYLENIKLFTKFVVHGITARRVSVLNLAIASIVFLVQCFFYNQKEVENDKQNLMKLNWLALNVFTFLTVWGDAATRVAFYFTPVYILIIPDVIDKMGEKRIKSVAVLTVVMICIIYLYIMIVGSIGNNNFYPYRTIFEI